MKPNVGNLENDQFLEWYEPLHNAFASRAWVIRHRRQESLKRAHLDVDKKPRPQSHALMWKINLPKWCQDQRNQMTGPADNAELVVKMINSGSPGVMLDLEDSMANTWESLYQGYDNITKALEGTLTYEKRGETHGITGNPVIWNRVRGLHLVQIVNGWITSAPLFDIANLAYRHKPSGDKPLCIYIPKTEDPREATWWADVLQAVAEARGWPRNYIKCMALVESYPMACNLKRFIYLLRHHILGLNLGRWDYMASWIDWNMSGRDFLLPDRNKIPHDAAFFQNLRRHLVKVCHEFGILAIGGMTALYPSRTDDELNGRALDLLAKDKANESKCGFDGAWTGHPDQNDIAVGAFPEPNQLSFIPEVRGLDLLDVEDLAGTEATVQGIRDSIRVCIRYRNGVINRKGAVLLDGYMEDLATDRICRLMIAQRIKHGVHSRELIGNLFDAELKRLISEAYDTGELGTEDTLRLAAEETKKLIYSNQHNPL